MQDPMTGHEVLNALFELRQGRVTLTAEQHAEFLDAVEGLVRALIEAPRGGDRLEAALWHAHNRTPALARFADAACPQESSVVAELETTRAEELRLLREMQADLGRY
jgi:hypothetical protein